jgi:ubiquinone/menaquinone biosynthesis C-methylase UbiE
MNGNKGSGSMTVKSQTGLFPSLLRNQHYSGTMSTLLYNWPIFASILFFGLAMVVVSLLLPTTWVWPALICGLGAFGVILSILITTYIVYDAGAGHEYDRLAELGNLDKANVVLDITCGKLRGTRGFLPLFKRSGHYFLIDIYDSEKMNESSLRRARDIEPPVQANRRIYQQPGKVERLPVPHKWADIIYCDFSLHEIRNTKDREALFAEFARVLKPNGRLLIAEHSLDMPNFISFGPGAFSFFPANTWRNHITQAGLKIEHHERWRGLVHLWVATPKIH